MCRYKLAENIDAQLKRMASDLKEIVDHLNVSSNSSDSSADPVSHGLTVVYIIINSNNSSNNNMHTYKAQIPLGSTRLDTFDVSSPCILAVSS